MENLKQMLNSIIYDSIGEITISVTYTKDVSTISRIKTINRIKHCRDKSMKELVNEAYNEFAYDYEQNRFSYYHNHTVDVNVSIKWFN